MARPIAKDHDAKRAHILKVAAQVFAEHGFARSSMSQVASACGISKATIYHYYSSKDALLFDILDTYLSALRDRVFALDLDRLPPPEQLAHVIAETLRAYEGMDHEHTIQIEGIPLLSAQQQAVLKAHQRDLVALMSAVIERNAPRVFAHEAGKLRVTVMAVFGMLNWYYMWSDTTDAQAREDYAQHITKLTLSGLNGF